MNDKIIIKIIKKIHFNLLAFFLLVFLAGFFIFVALLEGFTISHLKFGDIKFEQLYLKWDNRLTVKVALIDLNDLHRDNEPLTLKPLSKITNTIRWMQQWVWTIDIQTIQYHDILTSIHYRKNLPGNVSITFKKEHLNGNFILSSTALKMSVLSKKDSSITLNSTLDLYLEAQKLNAFAQLTLPNTPTLNFYARGDQTKITIDATADRPFTTINDIVDFFEIDPKTKPWITHYAKADKLSLHQCHGSFLYDNPQQLMQSLVIKASVDNVQYTFAPTIAPIIAPKVDLVFQKGILAIYPQQAHFYTLPTQKSYLYLDFNPKHILLNAHILTDKGQLNDSILNVLHYYNIIVPIRQNSGTCNVDLNLIIDLNNFNTTAKGKFIPDKSELQLENFIFQTVGGIVTLDTSKVSFGGFDATYKNSLHAKVDGSFDAHTGKGDVQVLPISCTPTGDATLIALSTQLSPTKAIYHIDPKQDSIQLLPSQWKIFGEALNVEGFTIPYDFKNVSAIIKEVHYSVPNKVDGIFKGTIKADQLWLQMILNKFNTDDLILQNKNYLLTLTSDKNSVNISSNETSHWKLNDQNFSLSALKINIADNKVIFNNITTKIDSIIEGSIYGEYQWKQNQGSILLSEMTPLNPSINGYVNLNKNQKFSFNTQDNHLTIHSQSLGVDFTTIHEGWKITVPDISLLSNNSPLLRQYKFTDGHADLLYYPEEQRYTFNGIINYPYHLMIINDESLSSYAFNGSYQHGKASLKVNDRLQIEYSDTVKIKANNIGINAPELARWLDIPHESIESKESSASKPIHLYATNTYLYLMKNRKILADTLSASLEMDNLDAQMTHAKGSAKLRMKDGIYYVKGEHFNDIFMENLFAFSDFKGGDMSFELTGKVDDFQGIMRIENATLKEYKLLNNVLSFINTVPSLATFSLPNYNAKGLPLKEAYSHYSFRDHQLHIDNFTLNSPELKMVGDGKINFKEDSILGTLTLKSDLGSKLGRVPMVGYILLGNDGSISTTVNVKGKLSDPTVETAIAKEIITAPFNILKRTVTYPFLWMLDDEKKK
ncbi:MAG: AsmA-like C-terminal domain-containing protein [Sulfuricurvum sp.]|nr:AsmA-like C-terminal domain-containing protein [Sulfuricurvum sp.]